MTSPRILLLPGWQNSGPGHWQSLWEAKFGDLRVEQHDWMLPLRGDWISRLEDVVQQHSGPVLLADQHLRLGRLERDALLLGRGERRDFRHRWQRGIGRDGSGGELRRDRHEDVDQFGELLRLALLRRDPAIRSAKDWTRGSS